MRISRLEVVSGLVREMAPAQCIFQLDGKFGTELANWCVTGCTEGLHDLSHGAGVLPEKWPAQLFLGTGCAGGLSPENAAEQVKRMPSSTTWVDAETHLRTDNWLDLDKVEAFLKALGPWTRYYEQ